MNIETNRLSTFTNWPPSAPVDPIRIAKAGFFYTGEGTEVQCFSCGGKISRWNYGDQVMWRHRHLEPNCAFVVNPQLSGNVPLVLGRECPTTTASTEMPPGRQVRPDSTDGEHYGLTEEDEAYKSDALRLLSFINWDDTSVSREALVNAGFYHAGEGRVRCAWCGGQLPVLRNLGSIGCPLEMHRMYFPLCTHAANLEAQRENMDNMSSLSSPSSPPSYTPPLQSPADTTTVSRPQSSGAAHNERLLSAGATWRSLGVVGGGARHPQQAALAARLATFDRWPADRAQTPRGLAEAGFFYTGTDDQVRCFYCDGGLGKWEAGDAPWTEHARWFPHCGYVALVKGQQFIDACRTHTAPTTESRPATRRPNSQVNFPVTEAQVDECMESEAALAALGAGLDAARVRRAFVRRLRATGLPFSSSEALIDAVLDEQLNEEAWSVSPRSQRLARDILAETLREFAPRSGIIPSPQEDSSDSRVSPSESPSLSPIPEAPIRTPPTQINIEQPDSSSNTSNDSRTEVKEEVPVKKLTLEEENRQLKEARLCKVCMDSEVSVVFLPCGHLVSCGGCGAALAACPLCRAPVRALVRAYLA
ncbi:death-associated inhibitor of apoptosis 2 [Pectinophora gossypiella]|nr:death-associated inhibitor of apoptosis 2 [Pectinophora gossypiella]